MSVTYMNRERKSIKNTTGSGGSGPATLADQTKARTDASNLISS